MPSSASLFRRRRTAPMQRSSGSPAQHRWRSIASMACIKTLGLPESGMACHSRTRHALGLVQLVVRVCGEHHRRGRVLFLRPPLDFCDPYEWREAACAMDACRTAGWSSPMIEHSLTMSTRPDSSNIDAPTAYELAPTAHLHGHRIACFIALTRTRALRMQLLLLRGGWQ